MPRVRLRDRRHGRHGGARQRRRRPPTHSSSRTREHTDLPVCVGLGVSTGDQAAEVGRYADGVIVGSALVRCLTEADSEEQGLEALGALARELADGVRRGRS